eukprot:gnl/MRDRNA2_/MRDRNA2_18162_c0_seq1.p1 gnl/MRDRNA2_/MRDRNA2_18162_c0~~gnl/MRDRNA2_/MRDRNA2_18162_c0_seq1.p1  ORF type:complete len:847 (-),score=165.13 gnl/MRDRNA2_/MRDRNA2_18162_c0_seq1:552-2858(-)
MSDAMDDGVLSDEEVMAEPRKIVVGRDAGRFSKCKYIHKYLDYTLDRQAFEKHTLSVEKQCETRGFCSAAVPRLPVANLKPQVTSEEAEDRRCVLCVDFVQMAAANVSPKIYCDKISSKYPAQKRECQKFLEEVKARVKPIRHILEQKRWSLFSTTPDGEKLPGSACDKFCEGTMRRRPELQESLKNKSPLLLAGEDLEPAKPGPAPDAEHDEDAELHPESAALSKLQAKLKKKRKIHFWQSIGLSASFRRLENAVQKCVAERRALLLQLSWESKYTSKRVWPRLGTQGFVSQKLEEVTVLMLRESSLLQPHLDLAEDLLDTFFLADMQNAHKIIGDLENRVTELLQNLEVLPSQLDEIVPPTVPSFLRRLTQKQANDRKRIAKCFGGLVERHEKFTPIFKALSEELMEVVKDLNQTRAETLEYDAKSIGLTPVVSQFYLMLPKKKQGRFSRFLQWLNPVNMFRTRFQPDKLYDEDEKECKPKYIRKVTFERLHDFSDCCTERTHQVMSWDTIVQTAFGKLSQVVEMMDYVKGNVITKNYRRAKRALGHGMEKITMGVYRSSKSYHGFWVQEEAALLLSEAAKEFNKRIAELDERNKKNSGALKRHTEHYWALAQDRKLKNFFIKSSRFETVLQNAKEEIRKGIESFKKIQSKFKKLHEELTVQIQKRELKMNEDPEKVKHHASRNKKRGQGQPTQKVKHEAPRKTRIPQQPTQKVKHDASGKAPTQKPPTQEIEREASGQTPAHKQPTQREAQNDHVTSGFIREAFL